MPTERLSITKTATATAAGTATFTFPAPATDLVWHGTLSCQTAPVAAIFSATVGGTPWSSWAGASIGGPVQALPGEVVQVTATGLTANATFQLQWIGRSDPLSTTSPSYPDTNVSPPNGTITTVIPSPTAAALEVFEVGGLTYLYTNNTGAATTAILGSPGAGNVWRLQRAVYELGAGATEGIVQGLLTQNEYALTSAAHDRENLDGLCVSEGLNWQTVGGGGQLWLYYDHITAPTLVAPSALGVVQVQSGQGVATIVVTLNNVTPGNQIIALFGYGQNTPGGAGTIATTAGTTSAWTLAVHTNNAALAQASIWSALAQTASVTVTVTIPNGAGGGQVSLLEVAKLNGTADATAFNSGGGVTSFPTGSITPGAVNDLAVAALGTNTTATAAPVGWVRDGTTGAGGNGALGAHLVPSGSSAINPAFTGSPAGSFAAVIATFPSL